MAALLEGDAFDSLQSRLHHVLSGSNQHTDVARPLLSRPDNLLRGDARTPLLGGEPLATKEIRRIVSEFPHVACPDARFVFITNGTVFDERTMELVSQAAISWVVISIDAARPERYAHIRRPGILAKTLAGVRAWKSLGETVGFPLVFSVTVMRDNLRELTEFTELAENHNVDCQFSLVSGSKAH